MSSTKILVVLGSTRDGRQGIKVANLLINQLKAAGAEPELVDPLSVDAPVLRQPLHFLSKEEQEKAPKWMKQLHEQIKGAHGVVLVSPEYNATAPPALTNLLDHFPPASFRHKPCSVVNYSMGIWGGCRARVALLPFVSELGMVCLPSTLCIPQIQKTDLDEQGRTSDEKITSKAKQVAEEIQWYAQAMEGQKNAKGAYPN